MSWNVKTNGLNYCLGCSPIHFLILNFLGLHALHVQCKSVEAAHYRIDLLSCKVIENIILLAFCLFAIPFVALSVCASVTVMSIWNKSVLYCLWIVRNTLIKNMTACLQCCLSDVDECAGKSECDQDCENTIGSYRCICGEGYSLNLVDRHSCICKHYIYSIVSM